MPLRLLQRQIDKLRQYNISTQRFFLTSFALGFAIDGVYGVLLNLYLLRLDYDPRFIGQVNSIGLLTFAFMSLPAGIMGTRWSSNRMLQLGVIAVLCGTIALPLAEFSPVSWRELWLTISYAVVLAGFSLYFVNSAPFLMAGANDDNQGNAFAMQNAILALSAFLGSLFAGNLPVMIANFSNLTLDAPEPYRYTLLFVVVIIFIALLVTLTIQEPDNKEQPPKTSEPSVATNHNQVGVAVIIVIAIMALIRFLQVAGVGTVSVFFNVYMDTELGMSPSIIGAIASVARLITVPTVLIAPRLMRRTSTPSVAFWASLATALFLVPLALVPNWGIAAVSAIFILSLTNLRFTAFLVYIMMIVPKKQQAVMAGAGEAAAGLSFALMALSGGYIITAFSFRELFLFGALLTSIGSLLFWFYVRYRRIQEFRMAIAKA